MFEMSSTVGRIAARYRVNGFKIIYNLEAVYVHTKNTRPDDV